MNLAYASKIDRLLENVQLPALPQSAITLLQLSKDPEVGPAEFAVPIDADPGLTSQVLKFVNSSYFGFPREISSVRQAITLVGMRTIKNFALWSAVFSLMPNPRCGPFDLKCLWQDSLRRAIFARLVCQALGCRETEDAFAAALLQDMAVPLLAKEFPEEYAMLLESRRLTAQRLSALEEARFGFTHADVAGRMAQSWNLPEMMVRLIQRHTQIDQAAQQAAAQAPQAAVALSALLPATRDDAWPEWEQFLRMYAQIVPKGAAIPEDVLARVDIDFQDMAPVLNISTPSKSLASLLEEFRGVPA
jgi:HD-like signal output (HDOD) protein